MMTSVRHLHRVGSQIVASPSSNRDSRVCIQRGSPTQSTVVVTRMVSSGVATTPHRNSVCVIHIVPTRTVVRCYPTTVSTLHRALQHSLVMDCHMVSVSLPVLPVVIVWSLVMAQPSTLDDIASILYVRGTHPQRLVAPPSVAAMVSVCLRIRVILLWLPVDHSTSSVHCHRVIPVTPQARVRVTWLVNYH